MLSRFIADNKNLLHVVFVIACGSAAMKVGAPTIGFVLVAIDLIFCGFFLDRFRNLCSQWRELADELLAAHE